ncbi:MAG: hypothetical protein K2Q06_15450 [Parvularculaceae bacterium]|nr:hypothetical protein [Parvularculaceae bacterium]
MDKTLAHRLLSLIGNERRLAHYWPGREAALLLRLAYPQGARIADIKRSRFAPLLQRPAVKAVMASAGDGVLSGEMLDVWPHYAPWYCHALGFKLWGATKKGAARHKQVSRPGYSLALLLNFSGAHEELYRAIFGRNAEDYFTFYGHPHADGHARKTCSWVRIDVAPETGEALIEEVQNDWLREAGWRHDTAMRRRESEGPQAEIWVRGETYVAAEKIIRYWQEAAEPHHDVWGEAALSAALVFLVETVGIRTIWMHTSATGARVKRIEGTPPPRSIYEDLPRRFCFERTREAPRFLSDEVSKPMRRYLNSGEAEFWRHQF